jgi:hypothetical protein
LEKEGKREKNGKPMITYTVAVCVITVSVVKAVSTPTTVDVIVSTLVTVVVAGAKASQEEQNDSPTAGSAPMAARHLGEPHELTQRALAKPANKLPAAMQSVEERML